MERKEHCCASPIGGSGLSVGEGWDPSLCSIATKILWSRWNQPSTAFISVSPPPLQKANEHEDIIDGVNQHGARESSTISCPCMGDSWFLIFPEPKWLWRADRVRQDETRSQTEWHIWLVCKPGWECSWWLDEASPRLLEGVFYGRLFDLNWRSPFLVKKCSRRGLRKPNLSILIVYFTFCRHTKAMGSSFIDNKGRWSEAVRRLEDDAHSFHSLFAC